MQPGRQRDVRTAHLPRAGSTTPRPPRSLPIPAWDGDAAYQVQFLRQSTVNPSAHRAPRPDRRRDRPATSTSSTTGWLASRSATATRSPSAPPGTTTRSPRATTSSTPIGPFGKSLLSAVTQVADPAAESARHEFDYYNTVDGSGANYDGFDPRTEWNTGSDMADRLLLDSSVSTGALGASESNSGEGHAYIGFNAVVPQKVGSFGGSASRSAPAAPNRSPSGSTSTATRLPDKVWREGNTIKFRLNESGPDGGTTFSGGATPPSVAGDLSRLSREISVNFQLSVEAYIGITLAVGLGGDVCHRRQLLHRHQRRRPARLRQRRERLVQPPRRRHPDVPHRQQRHDRPAACRRRQPRPSRSTRSPTSRRTSRRSPRCIDTVRRWTAPFNGNISINAPVTFTGTRLARRRACRDPAQRHRGRRRQPDHQRLDGVRGTPIPRTVSRGDQIYFRVGSVNDGAQRRGRAGTRRSPTPDLGTRLPTDPNGLSQIVYSSVGRLHPRRAARAASWSCRTPATSGSRRR